jgi:Ring finger domain
MDYGNNDSIQDELLRIIRETLRENYTQPLPQTRNRNTYTTNTRTRRQQETTEVISLLRELLYLYNDNICDYQENMRLILQTIYSLSQNLQNPSPSANNVRTPSYTRNYNWNRWNSRDLENLIYYAIYPTNANGTMRHANWAFNTYRDDVVNIPTMQQIEAATTNYEYSNENAENNTNCPITLDEFQEGEQVCRIRHCGHIFRRSSIQNWFQRNTHCPVCRYDIRNIASTETSNTPDRPNPQEQYNDFYNRIQESLSEIVNTYMNGNQTIDISNNLVYSFEFPIMLNDISNNTIYR